MFNNVKYRYMFNYSYYLSHSRSLDGTPGAGCTKGGQRYLPDSGFFKLFKIVQLLV